MGANRPAGLPALYRALLELGLEDWIPLPEALATPEVRETVKQGEIVHAVREALVELLLGGRIRIYRGRWDADPVPVSATQAVELLNEDRWYSFRIDDTDEERLYFVNVENIREE
jgi:hypothetical protein